VFAFDRDTRLEPAGDGSFRAALDPGWNIGSVPNGGYQMAIAARALTEVLDRPHPLSLSAHFFDRTEAAEVEVRVEVTGKRHTTAVASASLFQGGRERTRFLGTFGDLGDFAGPTHVAEGPPALPELDTLVPMPFVEGFTPEFSRRVDLRFDPETLPWEPDPKGDATLRGVIRFADGRPPDVSSLPLFADAFPPALFRTQGFRGWVPTLSLDVQVRGRPRPGWLRCAFTTRFLKSGLLEEDGRIWDEAGDLVALSRQLAVVRENG